MENPNFYAIIPANVRYDLRLKPNAKLLYGEITALTNRKGYCYANNSYFAELYNVSNETVSRWISDLVEFGYLKITLIYVNNTKQVAERRLFLCPSIDEKINPLLTKKSTPIDEKINTPIDKKVKDNNTLINNTDNNTKKEKTQSKNFANSPSSFEVVCLADNNIQMQKEQQYQAEVKIKISAKEKTKDGGGEFEIFCNAYPNKLGKSKSETKFAVACKKIGFDNLMLCVENYKAFVDAERKNGFPNLSYMHLSTFINGRYEDFLVNEKQTEIDNSPKYKGISLATEVNMKIAVGAQSKLDLGFVLRLAIRTPQNIHNITYNGTGISLEELPQITQLLKNTKYEN